MKYTLRVLALKGRDLTPKDRSGKSDPYLVIRIANQYHQTQVCPQTLEPEWDDLANFTISGETKSLSIECWDKDKIGKDYMGQLDLELTSFFDQNGAIVWEKAEPAWYKLESKRPKHPKITGELFLKIGWLVPPKSLPITTEAFVIPTEPFCWWLPLLSKLCAGDRTTAEKALKRALAEEEQAEFQSDDPSSPPPLPLRVTGIESASEPVGVMFVDIVEATNLPKKKAALLNYDVDPFVVFSFSRNNFKTRHLPHTLNPQWEERTLFNVKVSELYYPLTFNVYDFDRVGKAELLATASVKLEDLLGHLGIQDVNSVVEGDQDFQDYVVPLEPQIPSSTEELMPELKIRALFCPYKVLRRRFWQEMVKQYDQDGNQRMSKMEIATMVDSLGSDLEESKVDQMFTQRGFDPEVDELTFDQLTEEFERILDSPNTKEHLVSLPYCPFCSTNLPSDQDDSVTLTHLATCMVNEPGKADHILMRSYVSEEYAKRNWFVRLVDYISYGSYKLGKNNANILVINRSTGKVEEEKMPVYIRLGIRLLYQAIGSQRRVKRNSVQKVLRSMSLAQGRKYNSPESKKEIASFAEFHQLNLAEVADPMDSFANFNEFFYRKLKPSARPIAEPENAQVVVSPADARCMFFPIIEMAQSIWIKGENFKLENLFKDEQLAKVFEGGSMAIFRLAPQDYHRFHLPCAGKVGEPQKIEGEYYTVNPMAIRSSLDVYGENTRVVSVLESPIAGRLVYVCIGAMMVGSIILTSIPGQQYEKGDEHGYFAFGGSTVLVFFEPGKITFDADLLVNTQQSLETLLKMGARIGTFN